ncbi:MAG: hypothetical protein AAF366_03400 [Pseudomonadota bacterium]
MTDDCDSTRAPGLLRIDLWGAFAITSPDGRDLTPRLAKGQALIAMLLTARDGRRGRSWLQAHLWSDRSKAQASASLRQALAQIRKGLGPAADIVASDRLTVRIDQSRIDIGAGRAGDEFLAGLDVRDEEFEDWLRQERAFQAAQTPPQPSQQPIAAPRLARRSEPIVALSTTNAADTPLGAVELFLVDSVARALRETFAVRIRTGTVPETEGEAVELRLAGSMSAPNCVFLSARCLGSRSSELIWSGHQSVRMAGAAPFEDLDLLAWINGIVAAVADHLGRAPQATADRSCATRMGLVALRDMFSLRPDRVAAADRMLADAYRADARAIFLAWRAQLRIVQFVERHGHQAEALRTDGLLLTRKALAMEPGNSSVLALAANAQVVFGHDLFASDALSQRSVEANPGNPFAWWARSFSYTYSDRPDLALAAGEHGHRLAAGSPYRFWWDMQVAMSACAARRIDRAILAGERTIAFAGESRPTMRYLVGLHAGKGAVERSAHWARRLRALEPDFTPDRLVTDGDYPASLLRRYAPVSIDKLRPIGERIADA